MFLEQTNHHPPITHILVEGPDKNWTFNGWSTYNVTPYPNSLGVTSPGWKEYNFKDGQKIRHNHLSDLFTNTFFGTMGH